MSSFTYKRTIHLSDTDAAGVVFFARTFALCHEAYEESLLAVGIELNEFLGRTGVVIPISHAEADYKRPLWTGDRVSIAVTPQRVSENTFAITYEITKLGTPPKVAATVRTEHVCIATDKRERMPLPQGLAAWIQRG